MNTPSENHLSTLLRRKYAALAGVPVLIGSAFFGLQSTSANATDKVETVTSTFKATNGEIFTATNHLVQDSPGIAQAKRDLVDSVLDGTNTDADVKKIVTAEGKIRHEWLVVWAGDWNAADNNSAGVYQSRPAVNPVTIPETARDNATAPDFLAVVDATKGSPTYGKVVNTVTTGPVVENEPHHMQYLYHKGDSIFAGGLYSDITYVFDVKALPKIEIKGVNLPMDTPCGSIPDAYWTLKDGTAYGTYMGGADVPGPCTYTNGEVRVSNGFGGSPGSIVHIGQDGKTLSEAPAALEESEDRDPLRQLPGAAAGDLCQPPRHPGPRGPRHPHRLGLRRAAQHRARPGPPGECERLPRHRAHLRHLRPRQRQAAVGLRDARRASRAAQPLPRGAARHHGGHGHEHPQEQGCLCVLDVWWRHLLHAGHDRGEAGVA